MRPRAPQHPSATRAAALLCSGWLAWAAPLPATAQPSEPLSHDLAAPAAVASAPTAPLAYTPPVALPPAPGTPSAPHAWHAANSAVAAFPRGHADILAWEQSHTGSPAAPAPQAAASGHTGHAAAHHPGHPPEHAHRRMAPGARP